MSRPANFYRKAKDRPLFWSSGLLLIGALATLLAVIWLALSFWPSFTALYEWMCQIYPPFEEAGPMFSLSILILGSLSLLLGGLSLGLELRGNRRLILKINRRRGTPPRKLTNIAKELGILKKTVYIKESNPHAFCCGLLFPFIGVSSELVDLLSREEIRAVLLHEKHHLLSRDPLKLLLNRVGARTLFFLPALAYFREWYLLRRELAADSYAIEKTSSAPLANALVKLLKSGGNQPLPEGAISHLNVTEKRIEHLLDPTAPSSPPVPWGWVAGNFVTLASLTVLVFGLISSWGHFGVSTTCYQIS